MVKYGAFTIFGPIIISVSPNVGAQGDNLPVYITGEGTHFTQSSSTTVWFSQGSSTINLYSPVVYSPTYLRATVAIPSNATLGAWDVSVHTSSDGTITKFGGFTIGPRPIITSIVPDSALRGQQLWVSITGQNTQFTQSSSILQVVMTQASSTMITTINVANVTPTHLDAHFIIPLNQALGWYDVSVWDWIHSSVTKPNGFKIVTPQIIPPEITPPIGPQSVTATDTLRFHLYAINHMPGDSLIWAADAAAGYTLPPGAILVDSTGNAPGGYVTWMPTCGQRGNWHVRFIVKDTARVIGGKAVADSEVVMISVLPGNPVITSVIGSHDTLDVTTTSPINFTLTAADPNTYDDVFWTSSALPPGASLTDGGPSSNNSFFTWTPTIAQAGVWPISFYATDNWGCADTELVNVIVSSSRMCYIPYDTIPKTKTNQTMLRFALGLDSDTITALTIKSYNEKEFAVNKLSVFKNASTTPFAIYRINSRFDENIEKTIIGLNVPLAPGDSITIKIDAWTDSVDTDTTYQMTGLELVIPPHGLVTKQHPEGLFSYYICNSPIDSITGVWKTLVPESLRYRVRLDVYPPTIMEVNPDSARPSQHLWVAITGSNTHFGHGASRSVLVRRSGSADIAADLVTVFSPSYLAALFSIPLAATLGLWDVVAIEEGHHPVALNGGFMIFCPGPVCGDVDGSGQIDISDVVYLVDYIFGDGPPPLDCAKGDANCDGQTDVSDVVYIIDYVIGNGPAPCDGPLCHSR